jgi:hypothetical protein
MAAVAPVTNPNASPGPYRNAAAIVTSDTVPLAVPTSAIYVGGGAPGDVTYVPANATAVSPTAAAITLKAVPVGTVLLISAQYVMATGTTATNLVALF